MRKKDPGYIRGSENINVLWARLIVEELVRSGADHFWIAPGSRSAPLALAAASHPRVSSTVHFDERGLAFSALGFSAATGIPSVVICTSGTAVANLFPAIIETSKKKLPMIVLTADRPPELRHSGSHQTIDQVKIFGNYVRWAVDLPCPDQAIDASMVLTTIDQAIHAARGNPGGPVHINCMFREPLDPVRTPRTADQIRRLPVSWVLSEKPYTAYLHTKESIDPGQLSAIEEIVSKSKNGVIVVGKIGRDDAAAVKRLASRLRWPLFPDISSGLRLGESSPETIHYFDRILSAIPSWKKLKPDCIVHVGGRLTSKAWSRFVVDARPAAYIMVLQHPLRSDPLHQVTSRVQAPPGDFCDALAQRCPQRKSGRLLKVLQQCNREMDSVLERYVSLVNAPTEIAIARIVTESMQEGDGFFTANSLPVRLAEMFGSPGGERIVFGANRGASGIDGTFASASGFARGLKRPLTLLIGDLAALHDLNSLALVKDVESPLVVVLLNNGGGGIFSLLPVSRCRDHFERFFAAAHSFKFDKACEMFGINYCSPTSIEDFKRYFTDARSRGGATVIEVFSDRNNTVREIRKLDNQAAAQLHQMAAKAEIV